MRPLVPALVAVAVMVAAASPPASAKTSVGVSVGAAQLDPANPMRFDAYHSTSNFRLRFDAGSPYTELMFGLVNRSQALDATRQYVFDTSGVSISAGAHYGFLRAGVGLEAAWLRQIVMDASASPTSLRFHNGGGFVVEPFVGVLLPFLKTDATELELSLHYPLPGLRPDPAIGPRLLLTLWLGGEALEDSEDDDEELEEEEGEEEGADDETSEDESEELEDTESMPAPAPAPVIKATPKPGPGPAGPLKPKPKK